MFVEFSVENYRSIQEKQTISVDSYPLLYIELENNKNI
jgi:hypothetical protein